jgi:hypothetical protein
MAKLLPLPVISCTSSDCKNDLHCFKATQKMKKNNEEGRCRSCGAQLIDWTRVHHKDLDDIKHTFDALKKELIRHHFWHVDIDQEALRHARRKGRILIQQDMFTRLERSIKPAIPSRDGYQTPKTGRVIYYAQHATATCCRTCVEYCHGIPYGQELKDEEVTYLSALGMMYIDARLPHLSAKGETLSSLRMLRDLSVF